MRVAYTLDTDLYPVGEEGLNCYRWEAALLDADWKVIARLTSYNWTGEWCCTREEAEETLMKIELTVGRGETAPYFLSAGGAEL